MKNKDYIYELLFCLLTPQSNAKLCWQAILELKNKNMNLLTEKQITNILKSKTRFHNNKAKYIMSAIKNWGDIEKQLSNKNIPELRNWLADNVIGLGMKESSHFLRNIGKSNNKIAILDRHILKNLKNNNVIADENIKNKNHYLELEKSFINFSNKIKIKMDELDLLFWSHENGEIFK